MIKCPFCQFDNEDGALFCEECKSDLGVTEPVAAHPADRAPDRAAPEAPAVPNAAVSEVTSPLAAVAVAEAGVTEAVPVAQVDAGVAAAAEVPIAVAVPLPETPPLTVAPEVPAAGVALGEAAPAGGPPYEPKTENVETITGGAGAQTASDTSSPLAAASQATATPPAAAETPGRLPSEATPKLLVLRGQRINVEYPLYEGDNYLGRADEKAVDIDLEDQEPPDRIWSSRQHALITYEQGLLTIEDLNSTNGTFVNRMRVHPGQKRQLQVNDVIQIGTVQLKLKV